MDFRKRALFDQEPSLSMAPLNFLNKVHAKAQFNEMEIAADHAAVPDVNIDLREVYFLIMHFLSAGPCKKTFGHFWNELLEHQLLPRRYHAWYSRSGVLSGDANDDGVSFPLDHTTLVERYPQLEKDHLVKLLKELILSTTPPLQGMVRGSAPSAADVTTLLGTGPFSLLCCDRSKVKKEVKLMPAYLRWPHIQADQVHGLSLREIGGGFSKHHRAPSIRFACYAIAKPSTMVQKMQNLKKLRGHRDAVYCAIFDRSGRYVITGSDDRLVKIWSMETAFCLASCRGHEGDITDLAVSSNNALVASASNDYNIRVWRLPDGLPISVLRGHIGAVTAIAFSPRPGSIYQLLSSSDDGTCRIWDARSSQWSPRIYVPKPTDTVAGKSNGPSTSNGPSSSNDSHCILCCAYNANGTLFVTGSSDTFARVWIVSKSNADKPEQPNHEIDLLAGHENDVNYVQFSGCAVASRSSTSDTFTEENIPKFKNSWFSHDNIVTCSRDGSAIIWVPRSRRSHGKVGRWTRAYHLKVPPPPILPKPPRGGPRQRLLPTPRGVNMIMWSLDNRFVLAAIMDCRICVWNATDGSLVHSLTGHSASTFVLDVHPFNPRIAMSAGYDGKTIVWDIWEGTPIRIYEIGRFKLVDGKFSPDGTSIVLSDDVGQLCFLNTGQGESQKDAKYDQFFLGDYRLLIRDTLGNILDQETQLAPYKRNIQDPLCDSTMVPYPEPYQSMYQKLRLGALGIEWRPSSIKFATGNDVGLGQDYQILTLEDLNGVIEPLPEIIDAMYWEPENEVINDDSDSEYNVPEEYLSDGEHESVSASTSSDPECSAEDNKVEQSHKNVLRRSKRKRIKAEGKLMTSSGRHVRRRNLDGNDGTSSGSKRTKKSNKGRKTLKGNSSKAKSLRSQRLSARNALNFVSHITEASSDEEDEGGLETDSSESELMVEDSNVQSHEHDINLQNVQEIYSKAEQASLDSEHTAKPPKFLESQTNVESRKRLVIKFSLHNSKKSVPSAENTQTQCHNQADLALSSRLTLETPKKTWIKLSSEDSESSSPNAVDVELSANHNINNSCDGEHAKVEDQLEKSADYRHQKIRWGEVKIRSSKQMKSEDHMTTDGSTGFNGSFDVHYGNTNDVNDYVKPGMGYGDSFSCSEIQNHGGKALTEAYKNKEQFETGALGDMDSERGKDFCPECAFQSSLRKTSPLYDPQQTGSGSAASHHENLNKGYKDCSGSDISRGCDLVVITNLSHEMKENPLPKPTKLRITSKKILQGPKGPLKLKCNVATGAGDDSASESHPCMKQNLVLGLPREDESSDLPRLERLDSHSNTKIKDAVYKEDNSYRARTNPKGYHGGIVEIISKTSSHNHDSEIDIPEAETDELRRTRSIRLKATSRETHDMDNIHKVREGHQSVKTSRSAENPSKRAFAQLPSDEWILSPKITVRSKSTRKKGSGYCDNDPCSSAGKKSSYKLRKSNWLMLSEQEEGFRYIPQLGDEIVYLRQGHQEYLEWSESSMVGPWISIKENIRAVEICSVEGLNYATVPGSGESCCKLALKFIDTSSSVFGRTFKLTLPELSDCPDFFVERTWYDAAIRRNWTSRDKCLVWWRDESGEGGNWWECRILSSEDKSNEFPGSPWERFVIQYKNEKCTRLHSPWELYDPDSPWEQPHINSEIKNKLLSLFTKLQQSASRNQDNHGILKLEKVAQKLDFVNRFPVPLSPEVIKLRLENDYYRSLKAMEHDMMVMLSNVQAYFGENAEYAMKMKRLSDWFYRTMSKL